MPVRTVKAPAPVFILIIQHHFVIYRQFFLKFILWVDFHPLSQKMSPEFHCIMEHCVNL